VTRRAHQEIHTDKALRIAGDLAEMSIPYTPMSMPLPLPSESATLWAIALRVPNFIG
jgi:hypothetical protein